MGLLSRIVSMIMGRATETVDKLETPEDKVQHFIRRMEHEVRGLEQAVTGAIVEEKRLKIQLSDLIYQSGEWEKRASMALAEGHEDLAREAIVKKAEVDEQAASLGGSWEKQKQVTDKLKESLKGAKGRVEQAIRDYKNTLARYQAARAQKQLAQTMTATTTEAPLRLMNDLNEKILKIEAETEATLEISGASVGGDLEQRFKTLERGKRVEQELARLKAAGSGPRPALPAASDTSEAARRVEELKKKLKAG